MLDTIKGLFVPKLDPNTLKVGDRVVWYDVQADKIPDHLIGKVFMRLNQDEVLVEVFNGDYKKVKDNDCAKLQEIEVDVVLRAATKDALPSDAAATADSVEGDKP